MKKLELLVVDAKNGRRMKVIEYEGTITNISELRKSKKEKEFGVITVDTVTFPIHGYCWSDTTGLFKQVENLKEGDYVKIFAEEKEGFISVKCIIKK